MTFPDGQGTVEIALAEGVAALLGVNWETIKVWPANATDTRRSTSLPTDPAVLDVSVGVSSDVTVAAVVTSINKAVESGELESRVDLAVNQTQVDRNKYCFLGSHAGASTQAGSGGYCGSVVGGAHNSNPGLDCALPGTVNGKTMCCVLCQKKILHPIGGSELLESHSNVNLQAAGILGPNQATEGVSVWFLVAFGAAAVTMGTCAIHVYLMVRHGWNKQEKPPTLEELQAWVHGDDEYYDEEYYEEEYAPPKPSVSKPTYGNDEEGRILAAADEAGIDMNDSAALIAFTKNFRSTLA